jgi:toxin secretion/phage lysis holin
MHEKALASFTIIGTTVSWIVDGIGLALTFLLLMMIIDIITGVMVAGKNGNISSSQLRQGLIRKLYILLLIACVYMIDLLVLNTGYLGDGVTIAFVINEFVSITENGGKLGVWMPDKVKQIIEVLKSNNKEEKKDDK